MIGAITDFLFGGGNQKRSNDAAKRADSRSRYAMRHAEQGLDDARRMRDETRAWSARLYGETAEYADHFMAMNRGDRDIASVWNTNALHQVNQNNHWADELGAQFTGMLGDFFGSVSRGAPRVSGGGFSGTTFEGRDYHGGTTYADMSVADLDQTFLEKLDAASQGANEMFDTYRDEFMEYVDHRRKIRESAQRFNTNHHMNYMAGLAAADAARNQEQQQRALQQHAASMGINPNSGRFASLQQAGALSHAANLAQAQTGARMQAEQVGFDRMMAAEQTGQFLPEAMRHNQDVLLGYQNIAGNYHTAGLQGRVSLENQRMSSQAQRDMTALQATAGSHNQAMQSTASTINAAHAANAQTQSAAMSANASMYGANLQAQLGALDLGLGYSTNLRSAGANLANAASGVMGTAANNQYQGLMARNTVNNSFLSGQFGAQQLAENAYNNVTGTLNNAANVTLGRAGVHSDNSRSNHGFNAGVFDTAASIFRLGG